MSILMHFSYNFSDYMRFIDYYGMNLAVLTGTPMGCLFLFLFCVSDWIDS